MNETLKALPWGLIGLSIPFLITLAMGGFQGRARLAVTIAGGSALIAGILMLIIGTLIAR